MSQPNGAQGGVTGGGTDPTQGGGQTDSSTGSDPNAGTDPGTQGTQSGTGQDPNQQTGQQQTVSREEFEQLRNQLRTADQKRAEAERKLTEKERAEMGELDRAKAERDDLKNQLAQAQQTIQSLRLDTAFLKDNTYEWHDSAAALRLADLNGVEYKEDGTVNGLRDALKKLAEANPWLLKAKEGNDGEGGQNQQPARRTVPMNNSGQQTGTDRTALESKFPALKGRVQSI
jgi:chromosome segregation ATPase